MKEVENLILEELAKNYKWITRDRNGELSVFTRKPIKNIKDGVWEVSILTDGLQGSLFPLNHLFDFISWEEKEPRKIVEIV